MGEDIIMKGLHISILIEKARREGITQGFTDGYAMGIDEGFEKGYNEWLDDISEEATL